MPNASQIIAKLSPATAVSLNISKTWQQEYLFIQLNVVSLHHERNEGGGFFPTMYRSESSGCSAVRLAHLLWEQGVPGSNPGTPTEKLKQ